MGGGLMQLVAYGAQDVYLTGNPQITFFKVVYRRHTNFSMECIEQTWSGSTTANGRCTATISRNGDLVNKMYLDVAGTPGLRSNPGSDFITTVEIEIGGQRIDRHSGKFMEAYAELTEPNQSGTVGDTKAENANPPALGTRFQRMSGMGGVIGTAAAGRHWVPLQFWFCRNPGLALPLIALQYHEVKVILQHVFTTVFSGTTTGLANRLWAEYIYLDTDERRRFAQVSHEYLIEQVQEQTLAAANGSNELNFNHPVKELIWAASTNASGTTNSTQLIIPGTGGGTTFQLKLNGHDRFAVQPLHYFSRVQTVQHHTGAGLNSAGVGDSSLFNDSICVYSFALKPEEHQPSGTCNFSRIDNAQLVVAGGALPANTHIYAINYNVLRIMSGMGGLAYSN
jgi:hypothetical protein